MNDSADESPLADLMPTDPLMAIAWVGCLRWAISNDDAVAAFRADTGNQWRPARTPLDDMIDRACGSDLAFIRAFAKWHNENIWGDPNEGYDVQGD